MILEGIQETAGEDKEMEEWSPTSLNELAVFPLAAPLIAGPGGILIAVLLTRSLGEPPHPESYRERGRGGKGDHYRIATRYAQEQLGDDRSG